MFSSTVDDNLVFFTLYVYNKSYPMGSCTLDGSSRCKQILRAIKNLEEFINVYKTYRLKLGRKFVGIIENLKKNDNYKIEISSNILSELLIIKTQSGPGFMVEGDIINDNLYVYYPSRKELITIFYDDEEFSPEAVEELLIMNQEDRVARLASKIPGGEEIMEIFKRPYAYDIKIQANKGSKSINIYFLSNGLVEDLPDRLPDYTINRDDKFNTNRLCKILRMSDKEYKNFIDGEIHKATEKLDPVRIWLEENGYNILTKTWTKGMNYHTLQKIANISIEFVSGLLSGIVTVYLNGIRVTEFGENEEINPKTLELLLKWRNTSRL